MGYENIREEELKNKVGDDFFSIFDCTEIIENVDFSVKIKDREQYFLWAEAKANVADIYGMLAQLVLTIGKARTFDKLLPPSYLGCFDCEKIAFVPYHEIQEIFYQNDFNWKVAPSNHETKEFKQIYEKIKKILNGENTYIFKFETDEKELRNFIKENFVVGKTETSKIQIDKNNFVAVYIKWLEKVKPTIAVNWDAAKKIDIIDGDFYLADLLSENNETIKEKLFVLLKSSVYKYNRQTDALGEIFREAYFSDRQKAHTEFWARYERPPKEDYWEFMTQRRDLLVPQDVRERKGSYFTPQKWVELSQKYLADVFGEDWQDKYYVWDCAAGTGNLLVGLTNKYNIWASTIDQADVDVMHDRIKNGANLLDDRVFQFDFLNDDFSKLPKGLQDIISNEKLRKKLIIYINPPYAEAMNKRDAKNAKIDVNRSMVEKKYLGSIGKSVREIFVQFLIRAYSEINGCKITNFATLKVLRAPNFAKFRGAFRAKLEKLFIIPANTFDNVKGEFPIGFHIWDTDKEEKFEKIKADVFDKSGNLFRTKKINNYNNTKTINTWLKQFTSKKVMEIEIAAMCCIGNDFQHNNFVNINHKEELKGVGNAKGIAKLEITPNNLIPACIYFAVRQCIAHTWLNNQDQFLYPKNRWKNDKEFQNDCLAFTLFHGKNNVSIKKGVNHWIPFSEQEINSRDNFDSHIMLTFISGEIIPNGYSDLFEREADKWCEKREFSPEAAAVFDAGRELWKYYHSQKDANVNAAFYDIRGYFQGFDVNGEMNKTSKDEKYNELIANLRGKMKILSKKIEPKVYEYGFLTQ